jgi:ankyrin repeat protein
MPSQHLHGSPDAKRDEWMTRWLRLVATGPVDAIRAEHAAEPPLVNGAGPHPFWGGRPQPLHVAIETGRADVFALLLEAGADVDGSGADYGGWSPLMLAAQRNRTPMRDALVARGAQIGVVEALLLGDDSRLESLLAAGGGAAALPDPPPNDGSLLMFARTPFAVDRLLALGVPADTADRWGTTPIAAFSALGDRGQPLVARLVAIGVPAAPAIHARLGDRDALERALARDPAAVRADAVLLAAVGGRHHNLVSWLLAQGASPNARADDRSRQTALHEAAWNGDLAMVELLVDAGADPLARDAEHDSTPRGWAETSLAITRHAACAEVARFLSARAG